ncbi:MAG: ABC transporter ATP-binding protein, partial [Cyclobacteriaceae bacterium]
QEYITEVNRKKGTTVILVSHDLGEIFRISHNVIILDQGSITRQGSPKDIFSRTQVSGKFRFTGEILSISKEDVIYVARVLIGNDVIKVVLDPGEIQELQVGDQVMVASKAFNPIIQRID